MVDDRVIQKYVCLADPFSLYGTFIFGNSIYIYVSAGVNIDSFAEWRKTNYAQICACVYKKKKFC